MKTTLTIKFAPTPKDDGVRLDSLAPNTVFGIDTPSRAGRDLFLLVNHDGNPYVNRVRLFDARRALCVGLSTGRLCHVELGTTVYPTSATLLIPTDN